MKNKTLGFLVAISIALSACAPYAYKGSTYRSIVPIVARQAEEIGEVVAKIEPLDAPVKEKKLLIGVPSATTYTQPFIDNFTARNGRAPFGFEVTQKFNINNANVISTKNTWYETVKKKRIYSSVYAEEMDSQKKALAATADMDVLYLNVGANNASQWYFDSKETGRQLFFYDQGSVDPLARVNSFLDSLLAMAIRVQ